MKKPSVLIVEPDGLISLGLVQALERAGYTLPDPVISGEEAVESVRTAPPDIIIMDTRLAGKPGGMETARRIRETSGIPVIFLAAHTEKEMTREAGKIPSSTIIEKPFTYGELLGAVRKGLREQGKPGRARRK